jgi:hypothetical protein
MIILPVLLLHEYGSVYRFRLPNQIASGSHEFVLLQSAIPSRVVTALSVNWLWRMCSPHGW